MNEDRLDELSGIIDPSLKRLSNATRDAIKEVTKMARDGMSYYRSWKLTEKESKANALRLENEVAGLHREASKSYDVCQTIIGTERLNGRPLPEALEELMIEMRSGFMMVSVESPLTIEQHAGLLKRTEAIHVRRLREENAALRNLIDIYGKGLRALEVRSAIWSERHGELLYDSKDGTRRNTRSANEPD